MPLFPPGVTRRCAGCPGGPGVGRSASHPSPRLGPSLNTVHPRMRTGPLLLLCLAAAGRTARQRVGVGLEVEAGQEVGAGQEAGRAGRQLAGAGTSK